MKQPRFIKKEQQKYAQELSSYTNLRQEAQKKYQNLLYIYNNFIQLKNKYPDPDPIQHIINDLKIKYLEDRTYEFQDFQPKNNGNFSMEMLLAALEKLHYPVKSFSWAINPTHPRNEEITLSQVKAYIDDPTCIGILINKGNWHYGAAVLTIPENRYCFADPLGVPDDRILINYHTSDLLLETIQDYNAEKLCFIFLPDVI